MFGNTGNFERNSEHLFIFVHHTVQVSTAINTCEFAYVCYVYECKMVQLLQSFDSVQETK